MISARYTISTCMLLALAAIPVVLHEYLHFQDYDGRFSEVISSNIEGYLAVPTNRDPKWVETIFDSADWVERNYTVPEYGEVRLFVVRSFDIKRVYHHPELAVLYGVNFRHVKDPTQTAELQAYVHILRPTANKGVAAYVLLYDDEFVRNPIWFQLRNSLNILFRPRKQMTLFLVYDEGMDGDARFDASPASKILSGAISSFLSQAPNVM